MRPNKYLCSIPGYKNLSLAGLVFLVFASTGGCTHNEGSGTSSVKGAETMEAQRVINPSVAIINENPSVYNGMQLSLSGIFKGWKGQCKGSPPVTRSDWMLQDETACIYVSGPLPVGLQARFPRDEPVTVSGFVRLSGSGKAYIEAK